MFYAEKITEGNFQITVIKDLGIFVMYFLVWDSAQAFWELIKKNFIPLGQIVFSQRGLEQQ